MALVVWIQMRKKQSKEGVSEECRGGTDDPKAASRDGASQLGSN
jgi:hypothetical protein